MRTDSLRLCRHLKRKRFLSFTKNSKRFCRIISNFLL